VSRIGNNPIPVPNGVDVQITPAMAVNIKGPKGQLYVATSGRVKVTVDDGQIHVARPGNSKEARAFHGLYQRLLTNMVLGVTQGFKKELQIIGVGYRVQQQGKALNFQLGYSHPILFDAPEGITLTAPEQTAVIVEGIDKQLVGQVAANIRRLRPPEPYLGKGVRYKDEQVRRKEGKSGTK
jgi:large subunit ribosomal protein L6